MSPQPRPGRLADHGVAFQCLLCLNYLEDQACVAFPDRIPDAIFYGFVAHDKPYPGDEGVQFTPLPGVGLADES